MIIIEDLYWCVSTQLIELLHFIYLHKMLYVMVSILNSPYHGLDQNLMNLEHSLFIYVFHKRSELQHCLFVFAVKFELNWQMVHQMSGEMFYVFHVYSFLWNHLFHF